MNSFLMLELLEHVLQSDQENLTLLTLLKLGPIIRISVFRADDQFRLKPTILAI